MDNYSFEACEHIKHANTESGVFKVLFLYTLFSTLYIWLSDQLVSLVYKDPESIIQVSIFKGWLFIALTTLLLYVLVRRLLNKVLDSQLNEHRAIIDLKKSEAYYRSLTEQIPAIIYRAKLNEVSSTTYVSPKIEDLGYLQDEWLNTPDLWLSLIHPEDLEHVEIELQRAQETNTGFSCEYRLKAKNGDWRSFKDEARILIDKTNNDSYLQGVMLDVTDQKVIEFKMRMLSQAVVN